MTLSSDPLLALAQLRAARSELDRTERRLIAEARARGLSWATIAAALGLNSRQAAEQRWLRLNGEVSRDPLSARAARKRQQNIDNQYGKPIRQLRAAVLDASRHIDGDPGWVHRHPRAELIRATLDGARDAPPGALFELVQEVVGDLDRLSWVALPAGLTDTLRNLRRALDAARPVR